MKHTETCIRGPCRPAKGESSLPQWGKLQHASILRIVFDGREQKQWVMASRRWVPRYDWIREYLPHRQPKEDDVDALLMRAEAAAFGTS
jgi:hypothetical protein